MGLVIKQPSSVRSGAKFLEALWIFVTGDIVFSLKFATLQGH